MELQFKFAPSLDVGQFNAVLNTLKQSLGRFGADIKPIDEKAYKDALKKFESDSKSTFKTVGDESKKAGSQVGDGIGAGFDKATESARGFGSQLGNLKSQIASVASGQIIATGLTRAFSAITSSYRDFINLSNQQEQAERRVEQAIRSTGGAAGFTADELKKMANEYQAVTTFGDDVILQGQAMLLTFTNIGRDVFPQATEAMLNMSAAMGTDLQSTAIQLGKALNDPIRGLDGLGRAGIQFSEEQKTLIQQLVLAGDAAGAQKIMLAELETQFGGMAEALADTDAGQMQQLANTFGDFKKQIGDVIKTVLVAFRPAMESLIGIGERIIPVLRSGANAFASLTPVILPVAAAFATVTASVVAYNQAANFANMARDAAQYGLSIVQTVIPGLVSQNAATGALAINKNALTLATIKNTVVTKVAAVATGALTAAQWLLNAAFLASPIGWVVIAVGGLVAIFVSLYRNVDSVRNVFDGLGRVFSAVFSGIGVIAKSFMDIIVSVGEVLWQFLIAPFQLAFEVARTLGEMFFSTGSQAKIFETIVRGIGQAVDWLARQLDMVAVGIKAFAAVVKAQVESVVGTIQSLLRLDFSGALDNMRNAGKNSAEAFSNTFNDEIEKRKFDKVKDEIVEALNQAAKDSNLTDELIENLAEQYGVSTERVKELADGNEKVQATLKQINDLKSGSIGFSTKLQLLQDKFNEELEKEKTLRLQLDAIRKTGTAEEISQKERELAAQQEANSELYKQLEDLKELEADVMSNYQKKTTAAKQQTREAASQYEIAKQQYELERTEKEFQLKLEEVELAIAQRRAGIIKSERDLEQEKLARAKQQESIAKSQFAEAQRLFDIAKQQFDIESRRGTVSERTQKEIADAQKRLNDYALKLRSTELDVLDLQVTFSANENALKREVNRIKQEIELAEIEYSIKLGIATDADLVTKEIEIIENRIADLTEELQDMTLSADAVEQLKLDIIKAQSELFDKQQELRGINREQELRGITDLAEAERQRRIDAARKVYDEELRLAGDNYKLRIQANLRFQAERLQADNDYLAETTRIQTTAASAMAQFNMSLIANAGRSGERERARNQRRQRLREEENELIDSFGKRQISRIEFLRRSEQLEQEYYNLQRSNMNAFASELASVFGSALADSASVFLEQSESILQQALDNRDAYNRQVELLNERLIEIEDKTSLEYRRTLQERNALLEATAAEQKQIYELMAGQFISNTAIIIAEGKRADRAIVESAFAMLERMVPILAAKILGQSLATYDSIMSFGATGFARAALITAGLYSAVATARSAALSGFKKGGYTGDGDTSEVAGVVHRREYVVNAKATRNKENYDFFEWANRTGGTLSEFLSKEYDMSDVLAGYKFQKQKMQMLIENDIIQVDAGTNRELLHELKLVRNEIQRELQELREIKELTAAGNYSRRTNNSVALDVKVSDRELIERVKINKHAEMNRM